MVVVKMEEGGAPSFGSHVGIASPMSQVRERGSERGSDLPKVAQLWSKSKLRCV